MIKASSIQIIFVHTRSCYTIINVILLFHLLLNMFLKFTFFTLYEDKEIKNFMSYDPHRKEIYALGY